MIREEVENLKRQRRINLHESFNSRILKDMSVEHGGIKASSSLVDLENISDEDMMNYKLEDLGSFEQRFRPYSMTRDDEDRFRAIYFNDGTILYDKRGRNGYATPSEKEFNVYKKREKRMNNTPNNDYEGITKDFRKKFQGKRY